MRKLLVAAFFVVVFGIAFAFSGIGSKGETHTVPACDWDAINSGDLPSDCWDEKNQVIVMDGGRFTYSPSKNVLTDWSQDAVNGKRV